MQYILPREDLQKSLSTSERSFLHTCARGTHSTNGSLLRLDGRSPSTHRPTRLSFSRSHNHSEVTVQFGSQTRSAASVHAELIPPPNGDRPNDGQVKFGVEVGPMGGLGYEPVGGGGVSNFSNAAGDAEGGGGGGSGGEGGSYLQKLKSNRILRLLERTLLIGGSIDAEALCVQSGAWVWRLYVDVTLLDDGGNAMDACVLAAVAALRHYRLPEVNIGGTTETLEMSGVDPPNNLSLHKEVCIIHSDDREPTPLPLHHTPLTATFVLFASETGSTTSVSLLLDPTDREELASNGLLTWSYNKYGEMCCLDFPNFTGGGSGGCELRPRQLMASAKLGKERCVEVCETLEVALEEAEGKAEKERMKRLKALNASTVNNISIATSVEGGDSVTNDVVIENSNGDDADNEEQYRQLALDYASGHFAVSVKEDKDRSASQKKNTKQQSSSLFHAILRTAQSNSIEVSKWDNMVVKSVGYCDGDGAGGPGDKKENGNNEKDEVEDKMEVVEIISHSKKIPVTPSVPQPPSKKNQLTSKRIQNAATYSSKPPSKPIALDSDEEVEVVQLQSEFALAETNNKALEESSNPIYVADDKAPKTKATTSTAAAFSTSSTSANATAQKKNISKSSLPPNFGQGGPKGANEEEDDDIDDLAMAMKKKKKSKKSKKK